MKRDGQRLLPWLFTGLLCLVFAAASCRMTPCRCRGADLLDEPPLVDVLRPVAATAPGGSASTPGLRPETTGVRTPATQVSHLKPHVSRQCGNGYCQQPRWGQQQQPATTYGQQAAGDYATRTEVRDALGVVEKRVGERIDDLDQRAARRIVALEEQLQETGTDITALDNFSKAIHGRLIEEEDNRTRAIETEGVARTSAIASAVAKIHELDQKLPGDVREIALVVAREELAQHAPGLIGLLFPAAIAGGPPAIALAFIGLLLRRLAASSAPAVLEKLAARVEQHSPVSEPPAAPGGAPSSPHFPAADVRTD